jgi:biotin carboxyl carrier protein
MKFEVYLASVAGTSKHVVELEKNGSAHKISLDGQPVDADVILTAPNAVSVILNGNGAAFEFQIVPSPEGAYTLQTGSHEFHAEVRDPRSWRARKPGALEAEGRQQILAPMPGKVIRILVKVGDEVEAGQGLIVVEAMKMQNEIRSPKKGKVERLQAKEGQAVNAGDILAWVD